VAKKKSELQKLLEEVLDSLSSLGEELVYWTVAFIQSMNKEFRQFLHELLGSFAGGFIPPMEDVLKEITEADIVCKR